MAKINGNIHGDSVMGDLVSIFRFFFVIFKKQYKNLQSY